MNHNTEGYYLIIGIEGYEHYDTLEDAVSNYRVYSWDRDVVWKIYYAHSCQRVEDHLIEEVRDRLVRRRHKECIARWYRNRPYTFRRGPVPLTGGKRNRKGRYQKNPHYRQMSMYGRNNKKIYRDLWDRKDRENERNWKSQRKTQYKPVYKD